MITRRSGIGEKKEFAEIIAGIKPDKCFERITGMIEAQYFETLIQKKGD